MIQVLYNGADITDNVSINKCYHDMYAEGRSDALTIRFNNAANLWDIWTPSICDRIQIVYGSISTGGMFICGIRPQNGLYELVAASAPRSGYIRRSKAWSRVRLTQIADEIAGRNGLTLDNQGIDDYLYPYILQDNESDFAFLHKRLLLEGYAFLVYDGKLVVYSQLYMEKQTPAETITLSPASDYKYYDDSVALYGSCRVKSGIYSGEYSTDVNNANILFPNQNLAVGSGDEATRCARGLLRESNKQAYTGFIKGQIMPQYSAASIARIDNARDPSWDGPVFITHIRNDYAAGRTKLFFRRPLEDY